MGRGAPSPINRSIGLKIKSTDGATTEGAPNAMRGYPIQGVVPGSCTPSCLWLEPLLLSPPLPSLPLPFPPFPPSPLPLPPSLVSSPWTARGYVYIYFLGGWLAVLTQFWKKFNIVQILFYTETQKPLKVLILFELLFEPVQTSPNPQRA